jgi:AcrR family transcriptional regulator
MPLLGKTKQAVVSEFRTAEILSAARKVFARKGYTGATVEDIAEAAGLAKGTVYLYFPSKREVYLEALKEGLTALVEETRRNIEAAATAPQKIRAFVTTRIRFSEENRDFVAIYQAEFAHMGLEYLSSEFRELYRKQIRTLENLLREAARQGEIRPVRAETAAVLLYEITRGLAMQRLLGWSRATPESDVESLFELIWKGLCPGE